MSGRPRGLLAALMVITELALSLEASVRTGLSDKKEFCQFDSFEARCDENEAIIMESAYYGRMRSGRCISGEGYIGCSADVRTYMDGHCSGRRHCTVSVTSLTDVVQPCRRDFTSYLEATYKCKKVMPEVNRCGRDKPISLTAESAMIIGTAMLVDSDNAAQSSSGPGRNLNGALIEDGDRNHPLTGTRRCSWQVRVAGGQRVVFRLTVFRPAGRFEANDGINVDHHHQQTQQTVQHLVPASSSSSVDASTGSCPWALVIDDGETSPIREALCWRTTGSHGSHSIHHRTGLNGQVECRPKEGLACSVHLEWPDEHVAINADEMPIFALNYEVIGCPNVEPGNGAIVERRDRDELVVRCPDSKETWYLTCGSDNRWIGEMFNCTSKVIAGSHKSSGSAVSFPHGLIAAIILGLIFGLVIGTASLGGLYIYRRRKYPSPRHSTTADLDDGVASDDYGNEKLRIEPPMLSALGLSGDHSHHHLVHLRTTSGGPPGSTSSSAGSDCWRMQTFDYSRIAGDTTTPFDLISSSTTPTGNIQPIYCPSAGRYGTSFLGSQSSGRSTALSGGTGSTVLDYMCTVGGSGGGASSSCDVPVALPRCGRSHCQSATVGGAMALQQMTYETPRFVPGPDCPTSSSAAESKVYFEMLDANKQPQPQPQQQQRRPAVTFVTNPE